jgi:hypothetical protein
MTELRTILPGALKEILRKHLAWLNDDPEGEKANLRHANLRHADLSYADLGSADLGSANLSYADLSSANLRHANLRHADLSSADLGYADLRHADLSSADLGYADLSYADLSSANLRHANLRHADLSYADLDMSVFPLWCGSLGIKVDIRLSAQIAYHFCRFETDDEEVKAAQQAIKTLANKFHRIGNDVEEIP